MKSKVNRPGREEPGRLVHPGDVATVEFGLLANLFTISRSSVPPAFPDQIPLLEHLAVMRAKLRIKI